MTIHGVCSTPHTRPSIGDVCMSASGPGGSSYGSPESGLPEIAMKVVFRLLNVFFLIVAHCAVVVCGIGAVQTIAAPPRTADTGQEETSALRRWSDVATGPRYSSVARNTIFFSFRGKDVLRPSFGSDRFGRRPRSGGFLRLRVGAEGLPLLPVAPEAIAAHSGSRPQYFPAHYASHPLLASENSVRVGDEASPIRTRRVTVPEDQLHDGVGIDRNRPPRFSR